MGITNKEKYIGVTIKQVKGIFPLFDSFFELEKFDHVVEIGTGNGGFSSYIAQKCFDMKSKFTTYDINKINNPHIEKHLQILNVNVITKNVNDDKHIEDIIKNDGRCLLLIDGALKTPQFNKFASLIKVNDIIMTHDYYKDETVSEYGTFVFSEVEQAIDDNNLTIVYKAFDNYLWLCVEKVREILL